MSMTVDYVQQRGKAFRYRRKVPPALRTILGKGEIVIPLGKTKADVLRNYDEGHRQAEGVLAAAWDEANGVKRAKPVQTARELFQQTIDRMKALGFNPYRGEGDGGPDDLSWMVRDVVADQIRAKYPTDPETDYPIGVSPEDGELLRALYSQTLPDAPEPTVEDAKRLYLKHRFAKNPPTPLSKKKDEQRMERAVRHITAALGSVPAITSLRRADARAVQTHMLRVINSPETVERYLNDVRALINHAIKEYDLSGVTNPFMGLAAVSDSKAEAARKRRKPFTTEQLTKTRERVLTMARGDDLKLIWRLLEGTGCRLSEVTGLRTIDVVTEGEFPHIDVEWHEERRVKTEVSRRKVPLIGDALGPLRKPSKRLGLPLCCSPGTDVGAAVTLPQGHS